MFWKSNSFHSFGAERKKNNTKKFVIFFIIWFAPSHLSLFALEVFFCVIVLFAFPAKRSFEEKNCLFQHFSKKNLTLFLQNREKKIVRNWFNLKKNFLESKFKLADFTLLIFVSIGSIQLLVLLQFFFCFLVLFCFLPFIFKYQTFGSQIRRY